MACAKIKRMKYMRNINDNVVQACCGKLFNAKKYRMKYFRLEIFVIYGMTIDDRLNFSTPPPLPKRLKGIL